MDNDVWEYLIYTCQRILFFILLLAAMFGFFIGSCVNGQEFDGICRLSIDGKQWSGVAISKTRILTVAHHNETGIVRAEFAEKQHGAFNRLGIQAKILKSNKLADLSLVEYNCPPWAAIKTYPVKRLKPARVSIRGYVQSSPRDYSGDLITDSASADGYNLLEIKTEAIGGMSGSGVLCDGFTVGIQFGGNRTTVDAVSIETIEAFLKE